MTKARILADYVAGGTTAAEFDYMDGVTSNVQTQLDAKLPLAGGTMTGDLATDFVYKTFDFLVVAGGGSGCTGYSANAGGGGAGGFRASWNNEGSGGFAKSESAGKFINGSTYTITVGAGGAGTQANPGGGEHGFNGENSSIIGPNVNITSIGGGAGMYQQPGAPGGSGGASGFNTTTALYVDIMNTCQGGGTPGQGHSGGHTVVYNATASYSTPGGGGAGAKGEPGTVGGTTGGAGGNGKESTITGSSVTYAGGGGGFGSSTGGSGGTGGGSAGGINGSITVSDATANTGGGGGCGSQSAGYNGSGAGGSGIVVIRLATADYSGTTTGSPTVTTSGSDTIIKFTSSGTYTA